MKSYRAHVTWGRDGLVEGTYGPVKVQAKDNFDAIKITAGWCTRRKLENVTSIRIEEV